MIEAVEPEVDGGRFPAKRCIGDVVVIEGDIFTDGHDLLSAELLYKRERDAEWLKAPMVLVANDRWRGEFRRFQSWPLDIYTRSMGRRLQTWRYDLQKRVAAEQDATVDYLIGAELIGQASQRARGSDAEWLRRTADSLRDASRVAEFRTIAFDEALLALMVRYPDRTSHSL